MSPIRSRCRSRSRYCDPRQWGSQLLELMLALTVLSVGAMGFLFATQANFKASRDVSSHDRVTGAFVNALETFRDNDFTTLYATFNNSFIDPPPTTFSVSGLEIGELVDGAGNPARVFASFHVDETTLPAEYGPVIDLDGDGALTTIDVSATYQLLPTQLTITFQTSSGLESRSLFILLGSRT